MPAILKNNRQGVGQKAAQIAERATIASRRAEILKLLDECPHAAHELMEALRVRSRTSLVHLLEQMRDEGLVKHLTGYRDASWGRWALVTHLPEGRPLAPLAPVKPSVRRLPDPPKTSWWLGLSREDFAPAVRTEAQRMQGALSTAQNQPEVGR